MSVIGLMFEDWEGTRPDVQNIVEQGLNETALRRVIIAAAIGQDELGPLETPQGCIVVIGAAQALQKSLTDLKSMLAGFGISEERTPSVGKELRAISDIWENLDKVIKDDAPPSRDKLLHDYLTVARAALAVDELVVSIAGSGQKIAKELALTPDLASEQDKADDEGEYEYDDSDEDGDDADDDGADDDHEGADKTKPKRRRKARGR